MMRFFFSFLPSCLPSSLRSFVRSFVHPSIVTHSYNNNYNIIIIILFPKFVGGQIRRSLFVRWLACFLILPSVDSSVRSFVCSVLACSFVYWVSRHWLVRWFVRAFGSSYPVILSATLLQCVCVCVCVCVVLQST